MTSHTKFITRIDPKPGNTYGLIKCHKEGRPLRIIAPGCNTAVENLSHWVRDQTKPLANTCKYRLQDTNDVIFWINKLNEKYAPFSPNTVLVSFDVVSMYPNISLEHGLRAIRHKVLNRTTNVPSTECIVDAVKLCRTCSNIQLKNKHYVPVKGCNQEPKDACGYTDIAMDEVDDLFINFKFNNSALLEYSRYRNDTFTPWSHGLVNLMIFKQALDDFVPDIYPTIRFTMSFDFKRIQILRF